jgi:DNA-binding response OmpR family regulator
MSSDRHRILCVEDDENTRELLTIVLGFPDHEAVAVGSGAEALLLMAGERFSLYVIGGLRGVSGLSLCRRIRAADTRSPVIIFSGNATPADVGAGLLAGADAYVVKPDTHTLIPTVRRLLEEPRGAPGSAGAASKI